jgi:hypothetical protein
MPPTQAGAHAAVCNGKVVVVRKSSSGRSIAASFHSQSSKGAQPGRGGGFAEEGVVQWRATCTSESVVEVRVVDEDATAGTLPATLTLSHDLTAGVWTLKVLLES